MPVTAYSAPSTLPTVDGTIRVAQARERCVRLRVRALAHERDRDAGDGVVGVPRDLDRSQHLTRGERLALQPRDRVADGGSADVLRLDHDDCRLRPASGTHPRTAWIARTSFVLFGRESSPEMAVCTPSTGEARATSAAPAITAEISGRRRAGVRIALQTRFSPPSLRRRRPRNGIVPSRPCRRASTAPRGAR